MLIFKGVFGCILWLDFLGFRKKVDVEYVCFDISWFDITHLGRSEDCHDDDDDDDDKHNEEVVVVSLYKHYVVS